MYAMLRSQLSNIFTTIHFKGVSGSDELEPIISSAQPFPTGGGMITPPERHRIL